MSEERKPTALSPESLAAIEREAAKYPPAQRASTIMAALRIAQKEKGWLANETIEAVAAVVGVASVRALEVATFYNMYHLRPVGRRTLRICACLPCALAGAEDTAAKLRESLGVEFGETSADGMFTLFASECFGACDEAPTVLVDDEYRRPTLSPAEVDDFLAELRAEEKSG